MNLILTDFVQLPLVYTQVMYRGTHLRCYIYTNVDEDCCLKVVIKIKNNKLLLETIIDGMTLINLISITFILFFKSVTICVYTYFISCLFSRQDIEGRTLNVELAFPVYTFLQFFFYIGWLKVYMKTCLCVRLFLTCFTSLFACVAFIITFWWSYWKGYF